MQALSPPQPSLTVGPLQEKAPRDGVEHGHAADVAPVVLNEALELLHRLVAAAALKLLSVSLREQEGLVRGYPGRQDVLALCQGSNSNAASLTKGRKGVWNNSSQAGFRPQKLHHTQVGCQCRDGLITGQLVHPGDAFHLPQFPLKQPSFVPTFSSQAPPALLSSFTVGSKDTSSRKPSLTFQAEVSTLLSSEAPSSYHYSEGHCSDQCTKLSHQTVIWLGGTTHPALFPVLSTVPGAK